MAGGIVQTVYIFRKLMLLTGILKRRVPSFKCLGECP
jgi:hypothetical protein